MVVHVEEIAEIFGVVHVLGTATGIEAEAKQVVPTHLGALILRTLSLNVAVATVRVNVYLARNAVARNVIAVHGAHSVDESSQIPGVVCCNA